MTLTIREKDGGLVFEVRVLPRSSMNAVAGVQENALKIKLKAPPVDGAANKMCREFLAKILKVPKSNVEIVSGSTGRSKQVLARPRTPGAKDELAALRRILEAL